MGLFEQFPYTNFHELNLDWLLHQFKNLSEMTEEEIEALKSYIENDIDDRIQTRITELLQTVRVPISPSYVVAIGDSYLEGWTPDGVNESWGPRLARMLNMTVGTDFHIAYQGGSGFIATNNSRNFVTMLTEVAQRPVVDPQAVDLVIVAGGFNDGNYSVDDIVQAVTVFCNNAKTLYPNARILIADMAWSRHNSTNSGSVFGKLGVRCGYNRGANQNGAMAFSNCWRALAGPSSANGSLMASDGYHPNAEGQALLAEALYSYIKTGDYTKTSDFLPLSNHLYAQFENDYVKLILHPNANDIVATANRTTGRLSGQSSGIWFDMPEYDALAPVTDLNGVGTAEMMIGDPLHYINAPCMVSFIGGRIRFLPVAIEAAGHNFDQMTDMNTAVLQSIAVTVPIIMA